MNIKGINVNIGDKVSIEHAKGVALEGVVSKLNNQGGVWLGKNFLVYAGSIDSIEVLERPLPTNPGAVIKHKTSGEVRSFDDRRHRPSPFGSGWIHVNGDNRYLPHSDINPAEWDVIFEGYVEPEDDEDSLDF